MSRFQQMMMTTLYMTSYLKWMTFHKMEQIWPGPNGYKHSHFTHSHCRSSKWENENMDLGTHALSKPSKHKQDKKTGKWKIENMSSRDWKGCEFENFTNQWWISFLWFINIDSLKIVSGKDQASHNSETLQKLRASFHKENTVLNLWNEPVYQGMKPSSRISQNTDLATEMP